MDGALMGWARGDDVRIVFTFPADVDLTGFTVLFTVKPVADDDPTDSAAVVAVPAVVDAAAGTAVVVLDRSQSAVPPRRYVWDLKLTDSAGVVSHTSVGDLVVRRVVTNRDV